MGLMTPQQFANVYDASVSKVFKVEADKIPDIAGQLFRRSPVGIHELDIKSRQYGGPGAWRQRDDGLPVLFDSLYEGYGVTLSTQIFKQALVATQEEIEADNVRRILDDARRIGKGAIVKQQKTAADVLNAAFTSAVGGDGTYLCSDQHLYSTKSPKYSATTYQDNKGTAALGDSALSAGRLALFNQLDEEGEIVYEEGEKLKLVVPPALADTADVLVNTRYIPGSANNDLNVHFGKYDIVVWNRLSASAGGSDTAWFLIHPDNYLVFYDRVQPTLSSPVVTPGPDTVAWYGRAAWVVGYEDWRGVWGSTGA